MKRMLLSALALGVLGAVSLTSGVNAHEPTLGQERNSSERLRGDSPEKQEEVISNLRGYPDLRDYKMNLSLYLQSGGAFGRLSLDTDGDGWEDLLYVYKVRGKKGQKIYFGKPVGFYIDEDRDHNFEVKEYHEFENKK